MKFLHVSDLHLGKRLHGRSLAEDHEVILGQILDLAARPDCDAVLIAGDVYNRAQPQPEAIAQFSRFLTRLAALKKPVFIVRGNHDGEAQLAYAAPLLSAGGLYVNEIFDGHVQRVELRDAFGPLHVWLLPYIKPVQARRFFPDDDIATYADAVRAVLSRIDLDRSVRNVLITHQYVFGAEVSDSEERSVGGLDQIPPSVFDGFDYVALGHLHRAQTLCGGRLRYCGAPLVFSFDECDQQKSATFVTIGEKGAQNEFELVPFRPLHPCRRLEGALDALASMPRSEDYVQIQLTDEVRPLDPVGTLRVNWPNLLNLQFSHFEPAGNAAPLAEIEADADPIDHFIEFYTHQNGHAPSEAHLAILRDILQKGGDGE